MNVPRSKPLHSRGRGAVWGGFGATQRVTNLLFRGTAQESRAKEGDSPVLEKQQTLERTPSMAGHVEPCQNLGGPSPKAKYSLRTDSEPVP